MFLIATVLYLFAPLIVSSALAGVVLRFDLCSALRRPIDAGKSFHGRRVFGDHKTWRGVAVAIAGCVATVSAQKYLVINQAHEIAVVNYGSVNVLLFGSAMGVGAMLGELPNSFLKRRLDIAPGRTGRGPVAALLYVWDQVDLLAAWFFIACWAHPTFKLVAASFAVTLVLHPTVSLIGYAIGARPSAR